MAAHLKKLERLSQLDSSNTEHLTELGENNLRNHSHCSALERAEVRAGNTPHAVIARSCQDTSLTHTGDAIDRLMKG